MFIALVYLKSLLTTSMPPNDKDTDCMSKHNVIEQLIVLCTSY